ncbi:metallophosphoesterase family protein [Candidatus Nanohalococcus occultus]|uniref:Phosphohydrolase, Icc/MPP superfamily n=1 Tax=Candidatus Nanohalococcus occultus TaxID=2978047 RepID=A0ABY8CE59_9ARCH|nr:Phosphohydrolase, Icc/MPP superfamily [Candidatus Nanohaloarchaeota archaeon SVXNc]
MALKILFTSDFHASEELKEAAIKEANNGDYDLFINLGDFMDMEFAEDLMAKIDIPAIGCTGNRDMFFDNEFLDDESVPVYNFLDADIDGGEYKVILIGGDFPENVKNEVREVLEDYEGDSSKVIIGSHYPPHRLNDKIHSGKRIGFKEFREIIMREKPSLWVHGHVHEDFGKDSLMDTTVLNAAADETGKAWSVTIGDDGGVESYEEVQLV